MLHPFRIPYGVLAMLRIHARLGSMVRWAGLDWYSAIEGQGATEGVPWRGIEGWVALLSLVNEA